MPALAAFAIFQFLWVWNDLLVAYVFLGGTAGEPRAHRRSRGTSSGRRGENWHLLTAAAFISMALPLVVFFSLQKYFVRGIDGGRGQGLSVVAPVPAVRRSAGVEPLSPRQKWRAIMLATLVLVPAYVVDHRGHRGGVASGRRRTPRRARR